MPPSAFARFIQKHSTSLLIVLSAVYLINAFGYFRLSHDTIRYLQMEEWIEGGIPFRQIASRDFLPYGYSLFLFLLSKIHLLNSNFVILFNIFYLIGLIYFIGKISGKAISLGRFMVAAMLSWLMIKSVLTARSEMQYLFFSSGAIWYYYAFRKFKEMRWLIGACIFFVLALLTRTIGICLLAAALLDIILDNRTRLVAEIRSHKKYLALVFASLVLLIYFFSTLKIQAYIQYALRPFQKNQGLWILKLFPGHLNDLGEVFLNTASSKINFLAPPIRLLIFAGVGLFGFGYIITQLLLKKTKTPPVVCYYIIIYSLIIFCWPFLDSRFWLPVVPFFILIIIQSASSGEHSAGRLISMGKWIYLSAGVFALCYYTFTSFSKQAISIKQDAGIWRNEYETYFYERTLSDTAKSVDPVALKWLKKMN